MTNPMIPSDALEATAKALHDRDCQWNDWHYIHPGRGSYLKLAQIALEAALPALLSHEREQSRLAHLDAMVNRETKRDELAAEYRRGYRDGLADRKQVTAEPRGWEPGDPVE